MAINGRNEVHKNQVEATRRWRESQRKSGNKPVTVNCPEDRVDELKALVAGWRAEAKQGD